jgi:KDO2-lipid IV(A) lauroyltransferase
MHFLRTLTEHLACNTFSTLGKLSLRTLRTLGYFLGRSAWYYPSGYKTKLLANIQVAFPQNHHKLAKISFCQMFETYFELPFIWSKHNATKLTDINNTFDWHPAEKYLGTGCGTLFISAHLGSYELLLPLWAQKHPVTVLYKPSKISLLQKLIESSRTCSNLKILPATRHGIRELIKDLRNGGTAGLLVDHLPPKGSGVYADFFTKPAYTTVLPQQLQLKTGCRILAAGLERTEKDVGYKLHIIERSTPLSTVSAIAAREINSLIEDLILRMPTQYLWGYNRYKEPIRK